MKLLRLAAVPALVCVCQTMAGAQPLTLTLDEALARAREQAPSVLVARARIEEARGRLAGARIRHRDNPTLDIGAGPRSTDTGRLMDVDIGISQVFETGGQRAARVAGAEAGIRREDAAAAEAMRLALRDVAIAFLRLLHAQERLTLLRDAEGMAGEVLTVAQRRYAAGDIAVLDVNVARSTVARARAARLSAEAERVEAAGLLQRLLGLGRGMRQGPAAARAGETVTARGALRVSPRADLGALIASVDNRPDLQALRADIGDAEAEAQVGRAMTRPDIGVGARYKHEEGHRAVLGEVTLTLPVFSRGQEQQAIGSARASRLRLELDTARVAAISEVESAYATSITRQAAVAAFEQEALPGLDENERLARRSFDVGQISLPELLLIRRELLETRLDYLDRLLDASEAVITQDALAGVLR
jgi:cobalt-zinc-cadmium efflux system outer membrane protein